MDDIKLAPLGQFTPQQKLNTPYGNHYLFEVGTDDIHGILLQLIQQEKVGFDFCMFGYDDDQLNQAILDLILNPKIIVHGTLDKSQSSGVHEKKILTLDEAKLGNQFGNSFAIGESATHQIAHTKSGVFIGQGIAFEGSTNWSNSGEGTGISLIPGINSIPGYVAQDNTLVLSTSPTFIAKMQLILRIQHETVLNQEGSLGGT